MNSGLKRGFKIGLVCISPAWAFAVWTVIRWGRPAAYVVTACVVACWLGTLLLEWEPWERP